MKKFFITFLFLFGFSGYALYAAQGSEPAQTAPATPETTIVPVTSPTNTPTSIPIATPASGSSGSGGNTPKPTPTPTPVPTPTPTPAPAPVATGRYKNGTYTGSVADAYYGYIQVRATVSGGKLTDVTFLQYPNDRGTSIEINSQAMPMLKRQALAAQSANVNGVSGATDTSAAFVESLSAALLQAGG